MGERTSVLICCISQEDCPGITGPPSDRKRSLWVEERGQSPEDAGRHVRFEWYRWYWGLAVHRAQGTHTPFTTVLFILAVYQSQLQRKLSHILETFDSEAFWGRFSPVYWYRKVLSKGDSSSSWANMLTLMWPGCFYFLRSPENSLPDQGRDAVTATNQACCKFHRHFQRWRWVRPPAFGLSRLFRLVLSSAVLWIPSLTSAMIVLQKELQEKNRQLSVLQQQFRGSRGNDYLKSKRLLISMTPLNHVQTIIST